MASIIGVYNRKGGVGKTTSCLNLACQFAMNGRKILLIDGDSQINLTQYIYRDNEEIFDELRHIKSDIPTINSVLMEGFPVVDAIREVRFSYERTKLIKPRKNPQKIQRKTTVYSCSVDFIPGSKDMVYFGSDEMNVLLNVLKSIRDEYDYIFVEYPPSFNVATMVYLTACDYIVVPLRIGEEESMDGYLDLLDRIREAHEEGSHVSILGLFYTFVHNNWKSHAELCEQSREESIFFRSHIREINSVVSNAKLMQLPLCIFADEEGVTQDYKNLCMEIEERIGD